MAGHLARMPDHRMPKAVLFSWLPQPCPRCGPRKRWRDQIRKDLQSIGVEEEEWYAEARRSRGSWRTLYRMGMEEREETAVRLPAESREVRCRRIACRRNGTKPVRHVAGHSEGKGTRRSTSAWMKGESQCGSSAELYSAGLARSGSGAREV